MPSKRKKLTPLQKEYNKQYKAYIKRIESAKQAGFLIPESYVKIKKEKPRARDIESLKKITRKAIEVEVKKGKLEYVSPFTGEVISGGIAVDISRKRKPIYIEPERPNYERPTTFEEAMYVKDRINDYFSMYNVPESNKEFMAERIMETQLRTIRGPEFDFEEWKKQEQESGWLFKDPNRPLDQEEINYIQREYDAQHKDTPEGQLFKPKKVIPQMIEELRGWNTKFNYYDEYLDRELAETNNVFNQVNEYPEDQFRKYKTDTHDGYYERPKTEQRKSQATAEEPMEYININNLLMRLRAVEFTGRYYGKDRRQYYVSLAKLNKDTLVNFIYGEMGHGNAKKLDQALQYQNEHGKAFQVWFLYDGQVFGEFMADLERLMFSKEAYYVNAEDFETAFDGEDNYEQ